MRSLAASPRDAPAARAVLILIAATFVARIVFGFSLGLGIDESYTVATSRHPQLSTFDHPPAAWWIAWASSRLLATESALALRLPFILLFCLTTWLMYRLTSFLFDDRSGFWAAATLNLAPVIAWTSGTWVVPDGPLNAALVGGAYAAALAVFGAPPTTALWWLVAGACGGLALLSKFHGVFLFAGVGLFLLTSHRHRRWLRSPWPYLGTVVAATIFLPVIVWNAQHGWVSFAFQVGRPRPQGIDLLGLLATLGGQALYLLPWLWLPLLACLGKTFRKGPVDDRHWFFGCLAIGPIFVFAAVSLGGAHVLPHWAAPGYLMLFPLLGSEIAAILETRTRYVRGWLVGSTASLAVVLAAVMIMSYFPWPTMAGPQGKVVPYPLLESVDWKDFAAELQARGLTDRRGLFIAATRWHEAAKIDYALGGNLPVLCLCRDPRGYGVLIRAQSYLGNSGLIVGHNLSPERVKVEYGAYFDRIDQMPPVIITHAGKPALELSVYIGHALRAAAERPSLLDPLSLRGP